MQSSDQPAGGAAPVLNGGAVAGQAAVGAAGPGGKRQFVVRGKSDSVVAGEQQPAPPNSCCSTPGAWDSNMTREASPAPTHAFETRGGTPTANPSAPFAPSPSALPSTVVRRPSFDGQMLPVTTEIPVSVPIDAVTQATQQPTAACAAPVYPSLDSAAADPALMMTATSGPTLCMGGLSATPLMGGPATYLGVPLQPPPAGQPQPYLGSPAPQGQPVEGHAAAVPPGAQPKYLVPAGSAPAAQHTCMPPNAIPTVLPTTLPTAPPANMSTVPPAAILAPAAISNMPAATITSAPTASIGSVPPVTVPTMAPVATASTVAPPTGGVAPAAVPLPTGANTGNPERRRKFAVQDNGSAAGAGGACRRAGTPCQDAAGPSMPPPVGITLPASYLPVAHLAAGRLPPSRAPSEASNDDSTAASVQSNADALQKAWEDGYAKGHEQAVANMSQRLDWLAHEWRAQQSLVQQIIANVSSRSPGLDELSPTQASLTAAHLAAGQNNSRLPSRRPSQESLGTSEAEAELRAVCSGSAAGPSQVGGTSPAHAGPVDPGAGAESNAAKLAKLQLDVSDLLATNRKLRQDNLELLREIFPCAPPAHAT